MKKASKKKVSNKPKDAPLAVNRQLKSRQPRIKTEGEVVVLAHRELFDWPVGFSSFTVGVSLSVNPGSESVFPWLSGVAANFETYRFRKLVFRYHPRCSATQAGQIVMAVDPKSGDNPPSTLQIASTYHLRANGNMWSPLELEIPKLVLDGAGPRRFVRTSGIDDAQLRSLYDVGRFYFITDGANPSAAVIGEMEVDYIVELVTPASPPSGPVGAMYIDGANTGPTPASIFGTSPATGGLLYRTHVDNDITLYNLQVAGVNQPQEYGLWLIISGTGISAISVTYPTANALTINAFGPIANATNTAVMYYVTFRPLGQEVVVRLNVTATTVTDAALTVAQLPSQIPF